MKPRSLRLAAALLPVAVGAAALPAAAQAVTVNFDGSVLRVNESRSGERNDVHVRPFADGILVSDSAGESPSGPCRVFNGDAFCPAPGLVQMFLGAGDDRVEYRLPTGGFAHLGDGNDTVVGGVREAGGQTMQPFSFAGGNGGDSLDYGRADAGVTVDMTANGAVDGRPGDREDVLDDFEHLFGSAFRDTLLGTPRADFIVPGQERDIVAGGAGDDVFYSPERDGADDYHGGPGRDSIEYVGRTQPLSVTLDNTTNDGEAAEFDFVRSNVENVFGGSGPDTLSSLNAFSRLEGRGGADTLLGGDGPDTLIGGPGTDNLQAGSGIDVVDARDGAPDTIDCGTESDSLSRDATEGVTRACESVQIGVLRLADRSITARAGKPAMVSLRWRHPDAWRKLRTISLRLIQDDIAVGEVTIRPRDKRVDAAGVAALARKATRLSRNGQTVSARLALRLDAVAGGEPLDLEIEATDHRGRRQLERHAGTVRVTR